MAWCLKNKEGNFSRFLEWVEKRIIIVSRICHINYCLVIGCCLFFYFIFYFEDLKVFHQPCGKKQNKTEFSIEEPIEKNKNKNPITTTSEQHQHGFALTVMTEDTTQCPRLWLGIRLRGGGGCWGWVWWVTVGSRIWQGVDGRNILVTDKKNTSWDI